MGRFGDALKRFGRQAQGEASGTQPGLIPFRVLQKATKNFRDKNLIGVGGFGKVYLGILKNGTKVAVKRRNKYSQQGAAEFQVEIELLLRLNHPNLVSLIGYCDEKGEMILVYEYMEEGSLTSHLYGSASKSSLSWKQRVVVSVGVAKGLHYLHTSSPNGTIHRDIKPDNILLDENKCAKIGDVGISRTGPDSEQNQTHVMTRAMGTSGYVEPQYCTTGQLTMKSDVYSFGVVLLEIISGRPVIDNPGLSAEKVNLLSWGKKMLEIGEVEAITDDKILGTIPQRNLAMFGDIVLRCLAEERAQRATMQEVLSMLEWELDCILAEEEVAARNSDDDKSDQAISSQPILQGGGSNALQRCQGKNHDRYSSVSHHAGLSAASTSLGSYDQAISSQPILQGGGSNALQRCQGKNHDRYSSVSHHAGLSAASMSLGSYDQAISSQPILQGGGSNALQRCQGKNHDRYSSVSHHAGLSTASTSLGSYAMKGKGLVELDHIIEDENSDYDSESD